MVVTMPAALLVSCRISRPVPYRETSTTTNRCKKDRGCNRMRFPPAGRSNTSLRKLTYSLLLRKRRQESACRPADNLVNAHRDVVITSVVPAKAGTQGDRSLHECEASLCLHPCEQAEWYPLYRRHERYCASCLATSIKCCRRICSRLRSA